MYKRIVCSYRASFLTTVSNFSDEFIIGTDDFEFEAMADEKLDIRAPVNGAQVMGFKSEGEGDVKRLCTDVDTLSKPPDG